MLNQATESTPQAVTTAAEPASQLMLPAFIEQIFAHPVAVMWLQLAAVAVVAMAAHFVVKHIVLRIVSAVIKRSRIWWDDTIEQHKVFDRLVPMAPLMVFHRGLELVSGISDEATAYIQRLIMAAVFLVAMRALSALLTAINDIYTRYEVSRGKPIKGYLQVVKIIGYIAAGIVIIAAVMEREPWFFLSGLGAMMAIILLIFRDTLLSLVAGIQLTNNDLIRVGDWIEMPQFNADGDVIDISLNVVKVQNWDRTVTCVPTHKFLEHSFKNWRSMFEGGGRRIRRSLYVDMTTVRFLTEEEINRFCHFLVLRDYMLAKIAEIDTYNARLESEKAKIVANARHLTNIGTFRAYVMGYIKNHPKVHKGLTMLVRQLQPTPQGLPLEIYCFTNDTSWANYESIQADIFDHLLAIASEFGLRVYQPPSGNDLLQLADSSPESATAAATIAAAQDSTNGRS